MERQRSMSDVNLLEGGAPKGRGIEQSRSTSSKESATEKDAKKRPCKSPDKKKRKKKSSDLGKNRKGGPEPAKGNHLTKLCNIRRNYR